MGLKCGNLEIKKLYLNLISFYFVLNNRGNYRKLTWKDGDGGVAFPIDGHHSKLYSKLDFNSHGSAAFITHHRN